MVPKIYIDLSALVSSVVLIPLNLESNPQCIHRKMDTSNKTVFQVNDCTLQFLDEICSFNID